MNIRNMTIMTTMMVLVTSSGCSGMKNFIFGRGARCGGPSCLPRLGGLGSCLGKNRPCATAPFATAPYTAAPTYVAPPTVYAPAAPVCAAPVCAAPVCAAPAYVESAPCETCYAPTSECQCNSHSYGPISSDPYLSSPAMIESMPYNSGPVYNSNDGYNQVPNYGGSVPMQDDFGPRNEGVNNQGFNNQGFGDQGMMQSRRFDTDGARILSVDPLPPGVTPVN